ncbi:MAG TPA: LysR family transcriptional regulator [Burkholderiales bacterium]|nr:LysR family transcriptional regulator [Burkholderiales bacterium]
MMQDVMLRVALTSRDHIGPGKVRLLELIGELGSISAAARAMDMSYRRAWLLVESMNTVFHEPVLTPAVGGMQGGGAVLTRLGREIIVRFRRMEAATRKAITGDLAVLRSRARAGKRARTRKTGATVAPPRLSRAARDRPH